MMDNLLDPMLFEDTNIKGFIRDHRCGLCGSHLVQYPAPNRKWYASCPEHGYVLKHMIVKVRTIEEVAYRTRKAQSEMNPLTEEQKKSILKDLGF